MRLELYCSKPDSVDGKYVCPKCTSFETDQHYHNHSTYKTESPIFLVKRINKNTKLPFHGCPNFPKCKHTVNITQSKVYVDFEDELREY